jgi:hypothetical protein
VSEFLACPLFFFINCYHFVVFAFRDTTTIIHKHSLRTVMCKSPGWKEGQGIPFPQRMPKRGIPGGGEFPSEVDIDSFVCLKSSPNFCWQQSIFF